MSVLHFMSQQQGRWAVYQSLPHELSLSFLWDEANSHRLKDIEWLFPKSEIRDRVLKFYSGAEGFDIGFAGIREPKAPQAVSRELISGIIVPAVGFDERGFRLGQGLGFYDRALAGYQGMKVGISFSELVQEKIPTEIWDERVDYLITELEIKKL